MLYVVYSIFFGSHSNSQQVQNNLPFCVTVQLESCGLGHFNACIPWSAKLVHQILTIHDSGILGLQIFLGLEVVPWAVMVEKPLTWP